MSKIVAAIFSLVMFTSVHAQVIDLPQAIDKALQYDPRISELENFVKHAQALKSEAEGSDDLRISANTFIGISPGLDGGLFKTESCGDGQSCDLRSDRYTLEDGLSPWLYLEVGIIKPLKTFGKIENYIEAAKNNIQVKQQDVRLQRGSTVFDVKRAYYGYLAARDTHLFLGDIANRVGNALESAELAIEEDAGTTTQSDVYALQSALGLVNSYVKKAGALEQVAMQGLKVLVGIDFDAPLELADKGLAPVELPQSALADLTQQALQERPEILQLNNGLQARKALTQAKRAMRKPNLYAGIVGMAAYSPLRDKVDNPHIYDPFNDYGATPMVGMQWQWEPGVQNAQIRQAQAELDALTEKNRFAQRGIPFQVSEAYIQANAHHESLQELRKSAKAARRWMISRYTEFEAGLEPVDKLVSAFQAYVLSYSDYLQTVYAYNMQVAQLEVAIGGYE